ncbi:hypothetical protein GCM10010425_17260 [Streptomyces spororaveus]|uniref:Uncharacterized protein n=1 Tax=Streptomyces spororaveus TaxID=284039 RepID=A0ABQ3T9Z6_9ACTN|nr:hypothetical protein Sspor_27470 [Streptomyces spororaveus]
MRRPRGVSRNQTGIARVDTLTVSSRARGRIWPRTSTGAFRRRTGERGGKRESPDPGQPGVPASGGVGHAGEDARATGPQVAGELEVARARIVQLVFAQADFVQAELSCMR